jgi:hypothetical protein
MSRTTSPLRLIFVALIFAVISGGFLFAALSSLGAAALGALAMVRAERTTVEVLDSRVETVFFPATSRRDRDETYYRPAVTYRYVVDGRAYTSTRVTPLNDHAGWDWASDLAGRYQPGQSYAGYYTPARPGEAFLALEIHPVRLVLALFCATLSLPGWYIVFTIARAFRRAAAANAAPTHAGTRRQTRRQRRADIRGGRQTRPRSLGDFIVDIPHRLSGGILISIAILLIALGWTLGHGLLMLIPAFFPGAMGAFLWWIGGWRPAPSADAEAEAAQDHSREPF